MKVLPVFEILFWLILLTLTAYHIFYWFIYELRRRKQLRQNGAKAVARIVDYKTDTDADGSKLYFPILEFFTSRGKRVVVQSDHGGTENSDLSKELVLCYEPNDPQQFFIENSLPVQVYVLPFALIVSFIIIFRLVRILSSF